MTDQKDLAVRRALEVFRGRAHVERFAPDAEVSIPYVDSDSQAIVVRTESEDNVADTLTVLDEDRDGDFAVHLLGSPGLAESRLSGRPHTKLRIERPSAIVPGVHFIAVTLAVPRRLSTAEDTLGVLDDSTLESLLHTHYEWL